MALKRGSDYLNTFRNLPGGLGLPGLGRGANRTYSGVRGLPGPWSPILHGGVKASLTTALTGTNNDLVYTAKQAGAIGNSYSVTYVVAGASTPLTVSVTGTDITVNVATNGSSVATSTAAQVKAAVDGNATAAALVSIANAASNDGTGVVTALSKTNLTGGSDVETFGRG